MSDKITVTARTFTVKEGMTPEDVMKAPNATAMQKKYAALFDSDGVKGYSQREANVFNATSIREKNGGVSLWTKYADGSQKGTFLKGDVSVLKYAPQGEIKSRVYKTSTNNVQNNKKVAKQPDNKTENKSLNFDDYYKENLENIEITEQDIKNLPFIKSAFVSEEAMKRYAKIYYASGRALNQVIDATGAYYNKVVDETGAHYNKVVDETGRKVNQCVTNDERTKAVEEMQQKRADAHDDMVIKRVEAHDIMVSKRSDAHDRMIVLRSDAQDKYVLSRSQEYGLGETLPPLTKDEGDRIIKFASKSDSLKYEQIVDEGWKKYNDIKTKGWAAYNKVESDGWKKYNDIEAKGWDAYNKATDGNEKSRIYTAFKAESNKTYKNFKAEQSKIYDNFKAQCSAQYDQFKAEANKYCVEVPKRK